MAGGRPRDDLDLHRIRDDQGPDAAREEARRGRRPPCQHPRADVRHLQHALRPRRNPPPDRGHRRNREHGHAEGRAPCRNAQPRECRCQRLHVSRVRARPLRGAGQALSASADRRRKHDQVPQNIGRNAGPRPRALHRTRKALDHQTGLGSLALGHPGFLRHRRFRHRRERNLCPRHPQLPRERPRVPAPPARRPTTTRSARSWRRSGR